MVLWLERKILINKQLKRKCVSINKKGQGNYREYWAMISLDSIL